MKDNFKKLIWLAVFAMIVTSFIVFADTLALFENNGTGEANFDIGKWIIKISDVTITGEQVQDIVIDSFTYANNANVAPGRIAPGSSAYFDLIVDATDCDVAVKYDITFNFDEMEYASNINFSVSQTGGNSVVRTGVNTYSGVIDLNTIRAGDVVTLRINATWENDPLYDTNDTELGTVRDSKLALPVTVHAVQYLGENLTPYVDTNQTGS